MSKIYIKRNKKFIPADHADVDVHEKVPVGNYMVCFDSKGGFYFLEEIESFSMPSKLYGNTVEKSERILNTFRSRPHTTGVLLSGEKGSGKTLLAKQISNSSNLPVLMINEPFCGSLFNQFVQEMQQDAILFFDEFEKVYDKEEQQCLLTLLDGVFPTKKLFILTCNDKWSVNSHMKNRPGRIFYFLEYKGLDFEFIREYCNDKLDETQHSEEICGISMLFEHFNFDMLKALVEEMNRYKEPPKKAVEMLNVIPDCFSSNDRAKYIVEIFVDGVSMKINGDKIITYFNPFNFNDQEFWYYVPKKEIPKNKKGKVPLSLYNDDDNSDIKNVKIDKSDLNSVSSDKKIFTFTPISGEIVVLTVKPKNDGYSSFHNVFNEMVV